MALRSPPKGGCYGALQNLNQFFVTRVFSRSLCWPLWPDRYGLDPYVARRPKQPEQPERLDSYRWVAASTHTLEEQYARSASMKTLQHLINQLIRIKTSINPTTKTD